MIQRLNYRSLLMFFFVFAMGLFLISCGLKAVEPISEMDTPEHHFFTGMKFLDQEKFTDAKNEFDRAIALDPKFSKAYAGNSLVSAYQQDFKTADEFMSKAWKYAKNDDEKLFVHVCKIRLYTLQK